MKKIFYLALVVSFLIMSVACNRGKNDANGPILSALNINGRAKIVSYDYDSFGFNVDGSIDGENGPDATLVSDESGYFGLHIKDGRLVSIEHSPIMMPSYEVRFTGYDDQNKPLTAEITAVSPNGDECIIPSVKISYPKLDEKGNWLEMELEYENPNGAWAPTVITRTIEYWPDEEEVADAPLCSMSPDTKTIKVDDIWYNLNGSEANVTYPPTYDIRRIEINESYFPIPDSIYDSISAEWSAEKQNEHNGYAGKVVIPNQITYNGKNYTVKGINDFAFQRSDVSDVTVPNSVTEIGKSAFESCIKLMSIVIPNSVKTIGEGAFAYCDELTSLTLPNSIKTISDNAFFSCGIASITIPTSVISIGEGAFCLTHLTTIDIPNSVKTIGESAFYWSDLTKITIPSSVTTIGREAFCYCTELKSVILPDSIVAIEKFTFGHCINLTSINIPDSVKTIGDGAFCDCKNLTTIDIPNSVTTIGEFAFKGCEQLTTINIPDSVKKIDSKAFSGCLNLMSITIPESTELGDDAFPENVKVIRR